MTKKMLDDFRFLFPKKADSYKNITKDKDLLKKVNNEYCLFYLNKETKENINLNMYLNSFYLNTIDGKPIFSSPDGEYKLNIINKLISKKMKHFKQLVNYHSSIMRKHKKAGSLSISIRILAPQGVDKLSTPNLKYFIKNFFNNARARKAFSKNIVGYYWVILLNSDQSPYLHINFYLKENDFNSLVGRDINEMCFGILNKNNLKGELIYHTLTKNLKNGKNKYNNDNYENIKTSNFSTLINDFNGFSFNLINDIKKESKPRDDLNRGGRFINHLYRLAKQTYFLPSGRSIGFASID